MAGSLWRFRSVLICVKITIRLSDKGFMQGKSMMIFFKSRKLFTAVFLLATTLALPGCFGVVVGAGAAVGVSAYDERGVLGVASDLKISAIIHGRIIDKDPELAVDVSVDVHEGRVLLTGVVANEGRRADVVGIAWKTKGVKKVYNEILVAASGSLLNLARDAWITTKLRSILTLDEKVLAINYVIETVNGTVYLLGIAQNQAELDRVIAQARTIEYVRRIVNHVRLKTPKEKEKA